MKFGVYVHIPYCIQRCRYCDFTTFEQNSIMPPKDYVELLASEILVRSKNLDTVNLESLYFGGGTPSLLQPEYIYKIIQTLDACGLHITNSTEVTIEINPATINLQKLNSYKEMGINRFSLGVQTFSDSLLKLCGREHNSQQTKETLELLSARTSNFSLDILYALPGQSLEQVAYDLNISLQYKPHHVSAYCLTLPQGHPMNQNRPEDDLQMEMLDLITDQLQTKGWNQYEISNFSLPNFESHHNLLYWEDETYWGLGLSAHSSFPKRASEPSQAVRFWNPKDFKSYVEQVAISKSSDVHAKAPFQFLHPSQVERLELWESLTDFCHISLRLNNGLSKDALRYRYGEKVLFMVSERLQKSANIGLINETSERWAFTRLGQKMSNQIFLETTFLSEDFTV